MKVHTILYVKDHKKSKEFYCHLIDMSPQLNVPGMTEFLLSANHVLSLISKMNIKNLLGESLPDPTKSNGVSRVELYFELDQSESSFYKSLELGSVELSPIQSRSWGGRVGYVLDFDGHVLAFSDKG